MTHEKGALGASWIDGRIICELSSISTVFQSYQENWMVIMEPRFTTKKVPRPAGLKPGTARSAGQRPRPAGLKPGTARSAGRRFIH